MDLIGREIGHYHITDALGEGGMAVVYKAYDTHLDRTVALKVIRADAFPPGDLQQIQQRFEREAKALARLSHPNIVGVIDFGRFEGAPYLVMEYLAGGSLKRMLVQPMPWQQAVRLLRPIARALAFAHSQNIVHRDVKPSNILVTQSGEPMLTDFGIAKILDLGPGQTLTSTGMGIGTPEYMAPEQGMGQEVDARADVYALGVVFYEMLTGRRPYEADTPVAVMFKHIMDPLPNPRQFAPDLPEAVEQVMIKALAKQAIDRYQSMDELAAVLERLTSSGKESAQPTSAPPPAGPSPAAPPVGGHPQPGRGRQPHASAPPPPQQPGPRPDRIPVGPPPAGQPPIGQPGPAGAPPVGGPVMGQPPAGVFPPGFNQGLGQAPPGGMPLRAGPPPMPAALPPLKKQMQPWLAVVITLVLMTITSLVCLCLFNAVVAALTNSY